MPVPYIIVFFLVLIVVTSAISYRSFKGHQKETAKNRPIAESKGLKLVQSAIPPPTSMFNETKKAGAMANQIAVDPSTGDISYHLYYVERPLVHIRHVNDYIQYNLAVAVVTTWFWIDHSVTIAPRTSILTRKNHLTGDEAMDEKYQVRPKGAPTTAAIVTPALMHAIDNPPFPMKNWLVHFLGPKLMVKCDFVSFEQRIELLRWTQYLATVAANENVPGFRTYTIKVSETTDREVGHVNYLTGDRMLAQPVDDYDPTADLSSQGGAAADG